MSRMIGGVDRLVTPRRELAGGDGRRLRRRDHESCDKCSQSQIICIRVRLSKSRMFLEQVAEWVVPVAW